MLVLESTPVLALAVIVFLIWRIAVGRRRGVRPAREAVVVLLLLWVLVVVDLTFFPLRIIFYDWHSRLNLVPLASIWQLVTETSPQLAFFNIVGNLLLLSPFGVLLPLLYPSLRRLRPLLLRGAAISATIELLQLGTRARAVDVDDVILNTLGVAAGFLVWRALSHVVGRFSRGQRLLAAVEDGPPGEPLRHAVVPVGVVVVLAAALVTSLIVRGTISGGANGIVAEATRELPGSSVVAEARVGEHSYLLVSDAATPIERVQISGYERVLPGRFTPQVRGDVRQTPGSWHSTTLTSSNEQSGDGPVVFLFGTNRAGATKITVRGNGLDERVELKNSEHFVIGFRFEPIFDEVTGVLDPFQVSFFDAAGTDISDLLPAA